MRKDNAEPRNQSGGENAAASRKANELLVFFVRRDAHCGECARELPRHSLIMLKGEKGPLCLACADMDHLEYLPRGNVALTRRASKYSKLRAVVLEWSRSRNRYERQGVLVEGAALEKAEAECLQDADLRTRQRERRQVHDAEHDREYVAAFTARIRELYPKCPEEIASRIANHACRKYSGRVGRSAAAKELDPDAVRLAVAAAIRHEFTNYDELLIGGYERFEAREMVRLEVQRRLQIWRGDRQEGDQP